MSIIITIKTETSNQILKNELDILENLFSNINLDDFIRIPSIICADDAHWWNLIGRRRIALCLHLLTDRAKLTG